MELSPSAILLYSGKHVNPLDLQVSDVDILDIAHALSNLCRYTGHVKEFYSVAQHSVIVSKLVPEEDALWGLLHDATESLMGDVSRPLKHDSYFGQAYRGAEKRAHKVIAEHFGLPWPEPPSVKTADNIALVTEARDLMPDAARYWEINKEYVPMNKTIIPLPPKKAEIQFLKRYNKLQGI